MTLPTYEYVSLDRLLSETKIELDIEGSLDDIRLLRWLIEGADEMQTLFDYIEDEAILEICNSIAVLPCNFVRFDRPYPIRFTVDGLATNATFNDNLGLTYTGHAFLKSSSCSATVEVQDGKLYFSTGIKESQCAISFLAVNVDEDGTAKIPILNKRPLIAYASFKYKRATDARGDIIANYEKEWIQGKLDRRGKSALLDSLQKEQLRRIMNATLTNYKSYAAI